MGVQYITPQMNQDQFKHWLSGYAEGANLPKDFVESAMNKLEKPFSIYLLNSQPNYNSWNLPIGT